MKTVHRKPKVDKATHSEADNFFEAIKNNPKAIIRWAKAEIREYQKLIRLIEKSKK